MNTPHYSDNFDILHRNLWNETIVLCYIERLFNSKRNDFQIYNNVGKDDQV